MAPTGQAHGDSPLTCERATRVLRRLFPVWAHSQDRSRLGEIVLFNRSQLEDLALASSAERPFDAIRTQLHRARRDLHPSEAGGLTWQLFKTAPAASSRRPPIRSSSCSSAWAMWSVACCMRSWAFLRCG